MAPITGYGDFSNVSSWEVDWIEVTALQAECANDNGIPVRVIPPGDGLTYEEVPLDQHQTARAVVEACLAGLNLPDPVPPSREQMEEVYNALIATKRCLEGEGYTIAPPPALETFIEGYIASGTWHPYNSLPDLPQEEWERLNAVCPQP
ncbi:MAG: hypothetical protein WD895_09820 [Acidimicrobiia bacterium]